jgi:hypothetical protein
MARLASLGLGVDYPHGKIRSFPPCPSGSALTGRSGLVGISVAASDVAAYRRSDNGNSVLYRGFDNNIYELFLPLGGSGWQLGNLTSLAGAPFSAAGRPACYVRSDNVNAVVYRGLDNHIYELWLPDGGLTWRLEDLTEIAGAPHAAGDPAAYVRSDQVNSIVYRGQDNHVYELFLPMNADPVFGFFPWNFGDLSAIAGGLITPGNPAGYVRWDKVNSVVCRGFNHRIFELSLPLGATVWQLNALPGAALAQGDPAGYRRLDFFNAVVYRGFDNHVYELSIIVRSLWQLADLTAAVHAEFWPPDAAGDPVGYTRSDGTSSVVYRGIDSRIHELALPLGAHAWTLGDLDSTGSPLAVGVPAPYVRSDDVNSVLYRGADHHIYEMSRGSKLADLSGHPAAQ